MESNIDPFFDTILPVTIIVIYIAALLLHRHYEREIEKSYDSSSTDKP